MPHDKHFHSLNEYSYSDIDEYPGAEELGTSPHHLSEV